MLISFNQTNHYYNHKACGAGTSQGAMSGIDSYFKSSGVPMLAKNDLLGTLAVSHFKKVCVLWFRMDLVDIIGKQSRNTWNDKRGWYAVAKSIFCITESDKCTVVSPVSSTLHMLSGVKWWRLYKVSRFVKKASTLARLNLATLPMDVASVADNIRCQASIGASSFQKQWCQRAIRQSFCVR